MFRSTSLTQRMAISVVLIVIATAALMAALNIAKFRGIVEEREGTIYGFELGDIRGAMENSLNLALPLSALRNTQPLIERLVAEDPAILGISIYDETGTILFDTDLRRIDQKLPDGWTPSSPRPVSGGADGTVLATSIINNFGKPVGGIVLRYDPARVSQSVTGIVLEVTVAALIAIAVTGLFAVSGAWWVLRGPRLALKQMSGALAEVADERDAPESPSRSPARDADFVVAAAAMLTRLRRAGKLIDQLGVHK